MLIGRYTLHARTGNMFTAPGGLVAGQFYLTQGFEQNLLLVGQDDFETLVGHFRQLSITDPLARLLSRLMLSNAVLLQIEKDRRIHIPASLAEFAQITDQAVLVGQGRYFEVWSPKLWQEQETRLRDTSSNASQFHLYQIGFA
jgi:MraZ protein